jgi:outer membrane protease
MSALKSACRFAAVLMAVLSWSAAACAESGAQESDKLTFNFGADVGYLSGSTVYRITVPTLDGVFESELEWPLDSWLAGVSLNLEKGRLWSLGFSFLTNISEGTGSMEDSDRFEGIEFVYSTSHTAMDSLSAFILDITGSYSFIRTPRWTFGAAGGFLYEYFDLTASDLVQYSPLGIEGFSAEVEGPVVTYEAVYYVPYLGVSLGNRLTPSLSLAGELMVGYAFAEDEDDHLLRAKLSRGETDGPALLLRLRGEYGITSAWSLTASAQYLALSTSGEQSQIFYDGDDAGLGFVGIGNEIDTTQITVLAGTEVRF